MQSLPDIIRAIRRNHALEHATMHILERDGLSARLVGRSDWGGFTLYGPIETSRVQRAVEEALQRLHTGEASLAVHERCGTRYAVHLVGGGLAAAAAWRAPRRSRSAVGLLGLAAAWVLGQPLSEWLQRRWMVAPDQGEASLRDIRVSRMGRLVLHRVSMAPGR
jgi:hypothetical protein